MPRNLTTALNSVPEEHVELLVDHVEGEHADPSVLVLPSRGSEPVCAMFSLVLCPFPKKQEFRITNPQKKSIHLIHKNSRRTE